MKLDELLSVEEAKQKIITQIQKKKPKPFLLEDANGLVLAEEVSAEMDLPPFDNSSMDGFAIIASDIILATYKNPVKLKVVEDIPAGKSPQNYLHSGEAARIMTGAPIPGGSTAVVPVEFTNFADRYSEKILPDTILIYQSVSIDEYIRPKGQDLKKGTLLFSPGHVLRPQDLGLLSGLGIAHIKAYPRPNIALISSGNEIIKPGNFLEPGKIYDMNTISIRALLQTFGANVIELGIADDDYDNVYNTFEKTNDHDIDLIVSTAGVSVGVYDYVNRVLDDYGSIDFWKVNIRPGKPLLFGKFKDTPVIGLPGNPVSAFVGCRIFLKPLIDKFSGREPKETFHEAVLNNDIESDGRESYIRSSVTKVDQFYQANITQHQGSGNIYSLVCANALLIIPAGVKSLPKGSIIKFIEI